MAWVVDTCLVIDVLDADPVFGKESAVLLDGKLQAGLVLCATGFIELAPAFLGDRNQQMTFLRRVGIDFLQPWDWQDTLAAHQGWNRYVLRKRKESIPRRPIADLQIGAFSQRFEGLLTRNSQDFAPFFLGLKILEP